MISSKAAVAAGAAALCLVTFANAFSQPASPPAPAASPTAADLTAPHIGAWGFDLAGRDTTAQPGTDFYRYANGHYIDSNPVPPDRVRWGTFDVLQAMTENRQRAILEHAAANHAATGDEARIGAFWRAFMNEDRIEHLGATPMAADLAAVRAAHTREQIAALMGRAPMGFTNSFFQLYINADERAPNRYGVNLTQSGITLPDRDYYLEPQFAAQRAAYRNYVSASLQAINWPDADAEATRILAMETQVAQASWTNVEARQADRTYNPMTRAQLIAAAPQFPWAAFFTAARLPNVQRLLVNENTAFPRIAQVFGATPVTTLQAWEAFNVVDQASPYLSRAFVDRRFEFRAHTLQGQPQQRPRWKRGVATVSGNIGDAVGRSYVAAYFPPHAREVIRALVEDLRTALHARIDRLTWMSPQTRQRAQEKLTQLRVQVGYPDHWRDYSTLTITDSDLYGDVVRSNAYEWMRQVRRLNQPVDRDEWHMFPQTVNAQYSQNFNEIFFPAAILQPPFFDPDADAAVNYGAIGAIIGHEITHGFDDQGRKYDGTGTLADWWTPEDATRFQAQTTRLGAQYNAFEPVPGMHINGDLTMGENVADLGGLLMALEAYQIHLHGQPAPVLDGYTGVQRVFLGFAQDWRSSARDDFTRMEIASDPHSPDHFRLIGVVRNVDAWYEAFNIQPSDPLYIPPDQRVRIW